jgi:RNase P protein component
MREAARRVDLMPGTDYVIVALPGILESSFDDVLGWVSGALKANQMKSKDASS